MQGKHILAVTFNIEVPQQEDIEWRSIFRRIQYAWAARQVDVLKHFVLPKSSDAQYAIEVKKNDG